MKGLVLGLGNEMLSDDAVGIRLARRLAETLEYPEWEFSWAEIGPLETMERLVGLDAAILIDSIRVPDDPPGKVYCFPADELPATEHLGWSHGIDLVTALELGKDQGYRLPDRVSIVAVNITDNFTLSERMTPALEGSFDRILEAVEDEVQRLIGEMSPPL